MGQERRGIFSKIYASGTGTVSSAVRRQLRRQLRRQFRRQLRRELWRQLRRELRRQNHGFASKSLHTRRVSVGTSFICLKDVVKDIVIRGVLHERRVYCLRKIKIIFICSLRCDVFQAKHQESRCLSQRLSTSFRHMKDVPIASHAKVRRPTVNGPVFIHVHAFVYIYIYTEYEYEQ